LEDILMLSYVKLLAVAACVALCVGPAHAAIQTTTGNGTWSNDGVWNTAAPTGSDDAVVSAGHTMSSDGTSALYTGSLTLEAGARINAGGGGSENAWKNVSSITMGAGSLISDNSGTNHAVPTITLLGDAGWLTPFGASDWNTNDFAAITGAFVWTTEGFNGHEFHYNAANTFSEYISNANDRHRIKADATGALGLGDVHINQRGNQVDPNRSAELTINADNVIADNATLYLNGPANGGGFAGNGTNIVIVNNDRNEVVAGLELWGTALPIGVYEAADHAWIGGNGSIEIVPEPASLALLGLGGLLIAGRRR
jgi:hypothetical protein